MEEKKKTVLLVEDDPSLRSILKGKLQKEGYIVEEAENGSEALERSKEVVPDLVILDIILPKKDGYEVIEEIRADNATKNMPIILLTNLESAVDVDKALSLGATNYLVKSDYTLEEIVTKVRGLMG